MPLSHTTKQPYDVVWWNSWTLSVTVSLSKYPPLTSLVEKIHMSVMESPRVISARIVARSY